MSGLYADLYLESGRVIDQYRDEIKKAAAELRHAYAMYVGKSDLPHMRAHVSNVIKQLERSVP